MARQLYDIRNYPRNAGTSQPARYNSDLMGEKVAIIEHNIADYIVFAHKLSAYLKYYHDSDEERPAGNWQNFLVNDVSYHLAVIVADKPELWNAAWHEMTEIIETNTEKENKKYFTWRYDFLYTLAGRLADAFVYSKQFLPWYNELKALFTTANLNIIYELLEKYYDASTKLVVDDAGTFAYKDLILQKREAVIASIATNKNSLSEILVIDHSLIDDGKFIFGDNTEVIQKVNAATEYLNDLAQQLLQIYRRVNDIAEDHLKLSLTNFSEHQPHVGLFYAFLQLLEEHKTDINSLLLRHLDYYYKQVLGVKANPYQPSKAYVTFEPAKNINEYQIKAGSLLMAAKDANGKDIFYKTQQDIVVNKAELGSVKSFTVIRNKSDEQNERTRSGEPLGIFACPQANSADGKGKPLQPGQSWDAFRATSIDANTDAGIGLSFYSSLLKEASPTLNTYTIKITFANSPSFGWLGDFTKQYGKIKINTVKEPIDITPKDTSFVSGVFKITFDVPEKTKISGAFPNATILFGKQQSEVNDNFFAKLKLLQTSIISSFEFILLNKSISVAKAETVLGMTDLSASFPAFGGVPKDGSWFKIIEPILKGKTISDLDINIEWASKTERSFTVDAEYMVGTNKIPKPGYAIGNGAAESKLENIVDPAASVTFSDDYVKIILRSENDLGHRTYAEDLAGAVTDDYIETFPMISYIAREINNPAINEMTKEEGVPMRKRVLPDESRIVGPFFPNKRPFPKPPYTPVIKSITLTCDLSESITLKDICYQYPHGHKRHDTNNLHLIPPTPFEGELFIGFKNLALAQNLNVLIQVEEGTADPTLPNPEVSWNFLHDNCWKNFDSAQFRDGTKGLIQSGIVSFVSPGYDCRNNTLLPAGEFWLRACIRFNEAKAVCKIFSIHTQAVLTQFIDSANDQASLGSNLPANAITQLFPKQASIKKVQQPYATFDGRLEEENKNIYTRTSERLRHKSRAVSAWDYEHIIAAAFPDIYKVKVLNHAALKLVAGERKVISKASGLIILIAGKTSAQSSAYKPLVSKSKLTAIKEFIVQQASPFANIEVINPLFEEITVDTIVTFTGDIRDEMFYEKKLQLDIKRFLSPWAFDDGHEPEFGGTIYRAALLDFIEELPYIDFVEKLEIAHEKSITGDMATASSPASVLISASVHKIDGKLKTANQQVLIY